MSALVDRITAVLVSHASFPEQGGFFECVCGTNLLTVTEHAAHAAAAVAAELPELAELEATKLLLEATREQLSRTIADFCAVRDALPRKQVEQILSAVEDPACESS